MLPSVGGPVPSFACKGEGALLLGWDLVELRYVIAPVEKNINYIIPPTSKASKVSLVFYLDLLCVTCK